MKKNECNVLKPDRIDAMKGRRWWAQRGLISVIFLRFPLFHCDELEVINKTVDNEGARNICGPCGFWYDDEIKIVKEVEGREENHLKFRDEWHNLKFHRDGCFFGLRIRTNKNISYSEGTMSWKKSERELRWDSIFCIRWSMWIFIWSLSLESEHEWHEDWVWCSVVIGWLCWGFRKLNRKEGKRIIGFYFLFFLIPLGVDI